MEFRKVHGAGNDFVLLPDPDDRLVLDAALTRALCDRHRGLGGDGVIRLAPSRAGVDAHVFMDYRNADGGIAEMCGNGVRTVAKHVADRDGVDVVRVDTRAGVKSVTCDRGPDGLVSRCRVDMGLPVPGKVAEPLALDDTTSVTVTTLSMGNPHAVVEVPDIAAAPVATLGSRIAAHPAFPDGVNVEFIVAVPPDRVRGRILERGVGETLASGTGAAAMAVAAHLLGRTGRTVAVQLPGGTLDVAWDEDALYVAGPAVEVARGVLDDRWLERARAQGARR